MVLGLEFDVLFLSTVRTSRMLGPGQHEGKDLGFLSNPKLLNTAITRAKFCLVVIGDPKALCSVGDCRVCWKTILSLCSENGTFHYRVPLTQVLSSIREEQTQVIPQTPYQQLYVAPPIPNEFPFLPTHMGAIRQAPPMTSPLYRPGYFSPIIPTALSTPPHYQSQSRVPAALHSHVVGNPVISSMGNIFNPKEAKFYPTSPHTASATSYSQVVGNHVTGGMGNIYSESVTRLHPTSPQKAALPTSPEAYASATSYSQVVRNHATGNMGDIYSESEAKFQPTHPHYPPQIRLPATSYSTRNVQASTEVNLKSTSSESAIVPTPLDGRSLTLLPPKHATDTMRNVKPPPLTVGAALQTSLSTEGSVLPSSGDSKHQHPYQNTPFNPIGYNEFPSSTNGLVEKREPPLHPDSDFKINGLHPDHKHAVDESSYPDNLSEESSELPATQTISPTKSSEESPTQSLCQTLRHNIASLLRTITESEEAVSMCH